MAVRGAAMNLAMRIKLTEDSIAYWQKVVDAFKAHLAKLLEEKWST